MELIDWAVLATTLLFIVLYGAWKTRKNKNLNSYLKGSDDLNAITIGLSVMATQASAITFLSTPGQAFESGMGFIQFYFGLPLALIIVSTVFIPLYYKLNVFTAYEFLEKRFGLNTRLLTSFLFLISRGLAAGITIYAPSIVLSTLLGWDLNLTNLFVGVLVIIYTVSGGSRAVSLTQKWQMTIIMLGMFTAFFMLIQKLPEQLTFMQAIDIGGVLGKMNIVDTSINTQSRYTLWSGLLGGLFLSLSYFGTDQSQVQRYLGGKNVDQSRMGLMFNAVLKIPMQFFILFVGVMLFVFYQFNAPPMYFNAPAAKVLELAHPQSYHQLQAKHQNAFLAKKEAINTYVARPSADNKQAVLNQHAAFIAVKTEVKQFIDDSPEGLESKDTDYVFLTFVLTHLPHGIIGLLLAVILSAAMSSTAGELNALASTSMIDYYKRLFKPEASAHHYVLASKILTVAWGALAICIALFANLFDNLIELVNILGSLFYGTILGIFLLAFFTQKVTQKHAIMAMLIGETTVITLHMLTVTKVIDLGYLWYNVIGCLTVVGIGWTLGVLTKDHSLSNV